MWVKIYVFLSNRNKLHQVCLSSFVQLLKFQSTLFTVNKVDRYSVTEPSRSSSSEKELTLAQWIRAMFAPERSTDSSLSYPARRSWPVQGHSLVREALEQCQSRYQFHLASFRKFERHLAGRCHLRHKISVINEVVWRQGVHTDNDSATRLHSFAHVIENEFALSVRPIPPVYGQHHQEVTLEICLTRWIESMINCVSQTLLSLMLEWTYIVEITSLDGYVFEKVKWSKLHSLFLCSGGIFLCPELKWRRFMRIHGNRDRPTFWAISMTCGWSWSTTLMWGCTLMRPMETCPLPPAISHNVEFTGWEAQGYTCMIYQTKRKVKVLS